MYRNQNLIQMITSHTKCSSRQVLEPEQTLIRDAWLLSALPAMATLTAAEDEGSSFSIEDGPGSGVGETNLEASHPLVSIPEADYSDIYCLLAKGHFFPSWFSVQ